MNPQEHKLEKNERDAGLGMLSGTQILSDLRPDFAKSTNPPPGWGVGHCH